MEETLTHRQLQSLIHISNVLNTSFDINTIIELIMSEAISAVDAAEGGSFWLHDKNNDILIAKSAQGLFYPKIFRKIRLKPDESMTGKTFLARKSINYPNEKEIKKALLTLSPQNYDLLRQSIQSKFNFSSVISSPIILKGDCIGVCTLDSFQQSLNFKQEDINLLEAICHQAAVALERSSLYKEKDATVKKLSYSIEAHRNLANLVLQGEDLHSILQHIQQWIGENIYLFNDLGECIASSLDKSVSNELNTFIKTQAGIMIDSIENSCTVSEMEINGGLYHLVSFSLGSRPKFLGLLIILSTKKMNDVDIAALEHACTVISLQLMKEHAVFETQQRLKGELVTGLFSGQIDETLIQKAKNLNLNPNHQYIAMIIHFKSLSTKQYNLKDTLMKKMLHIAGQTFIEKPFQGMTVRLHNQIIVLLSYPVNVPSSSLVSQLKQKAKWFQQEIYSCSWKLKVVFGIGRVKQGLVYVQKSLHEAEECLKFIQRYHRDHILHYSDLGIQRFILQHPEEEVTEFIHEVLGSLIEYEQSRKGELVKTLFFYLERNQNLKQTADALHVHINTLNYRLKRISEILSVDFSDSKQLLNIQLAVSIYEFMMQRPEN